MAGNIKNTAVSVHQRLLHKAKESYRPFNELLQRFAIERFIYRISKSPHANRFILKGSLDVFGVERTGFTSHHGHRSSGETRQQHGFAIKVAGFLTDSSGTRCRFAPD